MTPATFYWKGRGVESLGRRRRIGMVFDWFLSLFSWLARPFLWLVMLEQPAVYFDLI